MNGERFTLDTNLLVYAIDRDAGEHHARAMEIVDQAVEVDCVLTLQVLGEFFFAVTRKGKMAKRTAAEQVHDWQMLFPIVATRPEVLKSAIAAVMKHRLEFLGCHVVGHREDSTSNGIAKRRFSGRMATGRRAIS